MARPTVRSCAVAIGAALFGAVVLLCYLPYGVFRDWFYLRFLLPAFPLAFVLAGALAARAASALPRPAQGLSLLIALTTVASVNIVVAGREQAFNLREYEARYRSAGRYTEAVLPRDAVIFAVQESGSARYYGRPIVRWDLLPVDLDTAVATLTAMHRHPVFLVEDWEAADLRKRFASSRIARLDWPPRADFGTAIHVLLFDPADRDQPRRKHSHGSVPLGRDRGLFLVLRVRLQDRLADPILRCGVGDRPQQRETSPLAVD